MFAQWWMFNKSLNIDRRLPLCGVGVPIGKIEQHPQSPLILERAGGAVWARCSGLPQHLCQSDGSSGDLEIHRVATHRESIAVFVSVISRCVPEVGNPAAIAIGVGARHLCVCSANITVEHDASRLVKHDGVDHVCVVGVIIFHVKHPVGTHQFAADITTTAATAAPAIGAVFFVACGISIIVAAATNIIRNLVAFIDYWIKR